MKATHLAQAVVFVSTLAISAIAFISGCQLGKEVGLDETLTSQSFEAGIAVGKALANPPLHVKLGPGGILKNAAFDTMLVIEYMGNGSIIQGCRYYSREEDSGWAVGADKYTKDCTIKISHCFIEAPGYHSKDRVPYRVGWLGWNPDLSAIGTGPLEEDEAP